MSRLKVATSSSPRYVASRDDARSFFSYFVFVCLVGDTPRIHTHRTIAERHGVCVTSLQRMGGCSVYELSSGKNGHLSNVQPNETLGACALWTDARSNSLRLTLGGAATGEGRLRIWDQVGCSAGLPSSFLLLAPPPGFFFSSLALSLHVRGV